MRAMPGGGPERPETVARARASALVRQHHHSLLRVAQHWSANPDDAQDAVQRALEIYMRRLDSLDPATELAWLRVVVKHEAIAIRSRNAEYVPTAQVAEDERAIAAQRPVDDLMAGRERVRRSKEALARLKPDEAKALVLKAQGLSYAEIGESLGWTYTKVNRCITEGRARFLKLYAELEAGEACERFAPTLAALAGGTADADAMLELRPHLRNCPACRATVRDLHATRLGRFGALWPIPALVAPLRWLGVGSGEPAPLPVPIPPRPDDDVLVPAPHLGPDDLEPVDMAQIYDAVERFDPSASTDVPGRWLEFKAQLYGWLHRMSGTDVVAAAQISAGSGGGRIATLGAVIGFCLSGIGAGTVCVVTGVLELPLSPAPKESPAAKRKPAPQILPEEKRIPRREPKPARPVAATPTPTGSGERAPARREQGGEARASRNVPDSPNLNSRRSVAREFNFESSARATGSTASTPSNPTTAAVEQATFEEAIQQSSASPQQQVPSNNDPVSREFGG